MGDFVDSHDGTDFRAIDASHVTAFPIKTQEVFEVVNQPKSFFGERLQIEPRLRGKVEGERSRHGFVMENLQSFEGRNLNKG